MLADQNRLEAFFHQLLARPGNRVDAGFEGLGNLAVTLSVASFRAARSWRLSRLLEGEERPL
jgi:hypothetical protein